MLKGLFSDYWTQHSTLHLDLSISSFIKQRKWAINHRYVIQNIQKSELGHKRGTAGTVLVLLPADNCQNSASYPYSVNSSGTNSQVSSHYRILITSLAKMGIRVTRTIIALNPVARRTITPITVSVRKFLLSPMGNSLSPTWILGLGCWMLITGRWLVLLRQLQREHLPRQWSGWFNLHCT